jgi:hypothetical protein
MNQFWLGVAIGAQIAAFAVVLLVWAGVCHVPW